MKALYSSTNSTIHTYLSPHLKTSILKRINMIVISLPTDNTNSTLNNASRFFFLLSTIGLYSSLYSMFSSTSSSSLSSLLLSSKDKTQFSKLGSFGSNQTHYSEFTYNDSLSKVPQVFLSFRGEQLRYNFVSHIVEAFEIHGIMFFIDKDELRGNKLTNLFIRIEESNIALVIFSSRYAESSWCMDELVKIKERVDEGKIKVIPIFYNVKPNEVRERTGEFGDKFWKLAKTSRPNQIKEWMEALESIPNNMGLSLEHKRSEANFIKEIVKEVERVLAKIECQDIEDHQRINFFQNKRKKMC